MPAANNGHAEAYARWFQRHEIERKKKHISAGRLMAGINAPPPPPPTPTAPPPHTANAYAPPKEKARISPGILRSSAAFETAIFAALG